jgi:hypothetical protein
MSDVLVPVVEPAEALPSVAYQPKPTDWRFVHAYMEAIEKDGRCSHEAIANRLGVTRQAVTKRLHNRSFVEWVNAQVRRATDDTWPLILQRAGVLALKGSIDHMNFVAKVRGEFKQGDGAPGGGGPVVNVLIRV